MIFFRAAAFAAAVAAAGCAGTHAQELPEDRAAALDAFVQTFVDHAMFDGNVLVDIGGETVYARSFGYANYEFAVPSAMDVRYRVASVSKAITDVAVARLVDSGELDLNATVADFLPDFPRGDEITIAMILEHRSGIPHTNRFDWGDASVSLTLDEILERLAAEPLDFDPGTDAAYSNGGYAVLARALEAMTGESYDAVLRDALFAPLGLRDTGHIADSRAVRARMATGYEPGETAGERRHTRFYAVEVRPGGGSLYSTAPDLLTFGRAVCRDGFISDDALADVLGMEDGVLLAQGRSPGFVAKLYCDRNRDIIVVSTSNSYSVPSHWGEAIAALATGEAETWPWPNPLPPASADPAPDAFVGRFEVAGRGVGVDIVRGPDGGVVAHADYGDSRYALPSLEGGAVLEPMYWEVCRPEDGGAVVACETLAGETMYDMRLERVPEAP